MQKAKTRLKHKTSNCAVIALSVIVLTLWWLVFHLLSNPPESPVILIEQITHVVTKPEPIKQYVPSSDTIKLINSNLTLSTAIKLKFDNEWLKYAELIARESSLNPSAINPSSGACGMAQALPCSKLNCSLDTNGVSCQLEWIGTYVSNRYGNIDGALAHHDARGWY